MAEIDDPQQSGTMTTMNDASAPSSTATIDPQRQEQAKRYARQRRLLSLVDLAIGTVFLAAVLGFGLHLRLRDLLAPGLAGWQPLAGWAPGMVAAMSLIFMLVYGVLSLPLSIYSGYILPRRYGLGKQSFASWLGDLAKGGLISIAFGLILLEVLYLLLAIQPLPWWLGLAGVLLLLNVVLANLAPVLILPLFFKQQPMPEGNLKDRLLRMAQRAGTRVRGVFVMNMSRKTAEGNAALMGLGNTRRIVIGDTMLQEYITDEIEVVLAHELGHHVHNDIWKGIAVSTALTLAGLAVVNITLHWIVAAPFAGLRGLADVATLPVLALIFGVYGMVTGPLGNTYSRVVERQADQYALDMTRDPATFISAFNRLANQNLAQLDPHPIIEMLFYDHPAIGRRIQHAQSWAADHVRAGSDEAHSTR